MCTIQIRRHTQIDIEFIKQKNPRTIYLQISMESPNEIDIIHKIDYKQIHGTNTTGPFSIYIVCCIAIAIYIYKPQHAPHRTYSHCCL